MYPLIRDSIAIVIYTHITTTVILAIEVLVIRKHTSVFWDVTSWDLSSVKKFTAVRPFNLSYKFYL